jgi:hypothetical protein
LPHGTQSSLAGSPWPPTHRTASGRMRAITPRGALHAVGPGRGSRQFRGTKQSGFRMHTDRPSRGWDPSFPPGDRTQSWVPPMRTFGSPQRWPHRVSSSNPLAPSSACSPRPNHGRIWSQIYASRRPDRSTWHASKNCWTRTIFPPRCWSRPFRPK